MVARDEFSEPSNATITMVQGFFNRPWCQYEDHSKPFGLADFENFDPFIGQTTHLYKGLTRTYRLGVE